MWLEKVIPHREDPPHVGGFIGARDAMVSYRDAILRVLEERATPAAVEALSRIEKELPHLNWMHRMVASAKMKLLRNTWNPLSPAEFFAATSRQTTRLVRSAQHLQEVILESLASLQMSLQGETPAAPDLWDEVSSKTFRPKDENHLSDYIKRHLENDLPGRGIVSLREVQIRRGEGVGIGERTDIHVLGVVDGAVPGSFNHVRVIVEVKGAWHAEVNTAMKSQLVDRYLNDNDCHHGIYVVGWYHCAQWDESDSRLKSSPSEAADELFDRIKTQAEKLSDDELTIRAFALNVGLR
jgi:hypothetical protein